MSSSVKPPLIPHDSRIIIPYTHRSRNRVILMPTFPLPLFTFPCNIHPVPQPGAPPAVPPILLRIRHYDFSLARRYHAGHVLTDAEAQALNQVLAENVRNNTEAWVRKAELEGGGGTAKFLSPSQLADLQARIARYAASYQFRVRTRTRTPSPIDLALDELASGIAESEGRKAGLDPDGPEVKLRYRQLLLDPTIQARAREIVAERSQVASLALEELLDVG